MRISLPDTTTATEMDPGAVYIPEIAKAGGAFAKAVYSNSKLPLRTFEAAELLQQ